MIKRVSSKPLKQKEKKEKKKKQKPKKVDENKVIIVIDKSGKNGPDISVIGKRTIK